MELRGTLSDFSLEAILGLIQSGHKTGTLHLAVVTPLGMARQVDIFFQSGEIASARCGSIGGLGAIREAAICTQGSFDFSVDSMLSSSVETTVPMTADVVLATIAEARNVLASAGMTLSAGTRLSHAVPADETISITAEQFSLLAVMHDNMTVTELVAAAPLSTVDSMRIIHQLLDRGLLAAGAGVPIVDQITYEGALSLAEYVGGKAGVDIFNQFFRPGAPVSEWKRALPDFRSAFQGLVGTDRANEVIAGLREITD
ncbi:MAG: DUF4388 domain-containing protein [Candidatus Cryosericum sp.]|nr:DUF4388 domain-containing protein [bacterium]